MTLRGNVSDFPLRVVLRLLADTNKTGELGLKTGDRAGALGLANGRVVCAVYGDEAPVAALGEIFTLEGADFEFTPWDEAPPTNLEGELEELLKKADDHRKWISSVREVIPNDGVRFRLSERAAEQGAVTFTSDRWRVVGARDGGREGASLAQTLHIDRDTALTSLAGLVRDGVIETIMPTAEPAPAPPPPPEMPQAATPPPPPMPEPAAAPPPAPAPRLEWTPAELARPSPPPPPPVEAPPVAPEPPAMAAPIPTPEPPAPPMPERPRAPAAQEWAPAQPVAPEPEPPAAPERGLDDRLAALSGIFGPAPASEPSTPPPPAPPIADQWSAPPPAPDQWSAPAPAADAWSTPPAADQWSTPPPAADTWTTPTPPSDQWPTPAADDPRLAAMSAAPAAPAAMPPAPAVDEWAAPTAAPAAPPKKKGLFGLGKKEKAQTAAAPGTVAIGPVSRPAMLAALSNALLGEYNSGQYGKGRIDERLGNLLMRVDEQADPIDRPLPIVDDRIDVQALDRDRAPAHQLAPYLALLVATIYGDAEKAFGKDKAKKGYRAAMVSALGSDSVSLATPELAGKLPKI